MAVAGLNPHSGENGLFGREEVDFVVPAIKEAILKGYRVEGPIGADSVFYLASRENTTQYFLFIMTRGILPPKHWILKGQFRLP